MILYHCIKNNVNIILRMTTFILHVFQTDRDITISFYLLTTYIHTIHFLKCKMAYPMSFGNLLQSRVLRNHHYLNLTAKVNLNSMQSANLCISKCALMLPFCLCPLLFVFSFLVSLNSNLQAFLHQVGCH